jgi:hypothetical protein
LLRKLHRIASDASPVLLAALDVRILFLIVRAEGDDIRVRVVGR